MIDTENLVLRKLRLSDVDDLVENGNDYDVHYYSFFLMKYPFTKEEAILVVKEEDHVKNLKRFGIELKETGKIIGVTDLYNIKESTPALHSSQSHESSPAGGKLKLGYWIGKNYRRKGYANDAVKKIIEYAFDNYQIDKVIATTLTDNDPSMNLLLKHNFVKTQILKNDRFFEGKYLDSVQFVLTREDYLKNKQT